jgi:hypothetical protein
MHSPDWYELPPMTFDLLLCFWLIFLVLNPQRWKKQARAAMEEQT